MSPPHGHGNGNGNGDAASEDLDVISVARAEFSSFPNPIDASLKAFERATLAKRYTQRIGTIVITIEEKVDRLDNRMEALFDEVVRQGERQEKHFDRLETTVAGALVDLRERVERTEVGMSRRELPSISNEWDNEPTFVREKMVEASKKTREIDAEVLATKNRDIDALERKFEMLSAESESEKQAKHDAEVAATALAKKAESDKLVAETAKKASDEKIDRLQKRLTLAVLVAGIVFGSLGYIASHVQLKAPLLEQHPAIIK